MKKAKLGISLMTSLLAVGALAACSDVHYDNNVILTYTRDGQTVKYTADDLLSDEFKSSENYQLVFDNVYKVIVKNYFTEVDKDNSAYGKAQLAGLKQKAEQAVKGDKQTAERRADTNNSSYDTEFESILSEKGCEDEDELFDYYLYQYEEETFKKNFENSAKNLSILKSGTAADATNKFEGYFDAKVPYHVSHILVKIEDSDSTNYANATVSESNAKQLFNVADALAKNDDKEFAGTADRLSDDSSPRGDLGLVDMDKTATYIDEFKYALYAYENLIGKTEKARAKTSKIRLSDEELKTYKKVNHLKEDELSEEKFPIIPLGAFYKMQEFAETDTGYLGQKVHDGDSNFYPRNILFNHFFNRHSFALVSPNKLDDNAVTTADVYKAAKKEIAEINNGATGTGFHTFGDKDGLGFKGTYLAAGIKLGNTTVYRPILVVRGGSSGENGYQGIHFIIVNRSRFEFEKDNADKSVASLEDYYTTYFPSEANYPTYEKDGKKVQLQTYVNSTSKDNQQSRAEEVLNAIKSFNSDGLKHYIFKKYLADGKLSIKDYKFSNGKVLSTELNKWMNRSEELKEYEAKVEWENKWTSYVENLNIATSIQANRSIEKACAIHFSDDHSGAGADKEDPADPAAWNEIGGVCNNGTAHK